MSKKALFRYRKGSIVIPHIVKFELDRHWVEVTLINTVVTLRADPNTDEETALRYAYKVMNDLEKAIEKFYRSDDRHVHFSKELK